MCVLSASWTMQAQTVAQQTMGDPNIGMDRSVDDKTTQATDKPDELFLCRAGEGKKSGFLPSGATADPLITREPQMSRDRFACVRSVRMMVDFFFILRQTA